MVEILWGVAAGFTVFAGIMFLASVLTSLGAR